MPGVIVIIMSILLIVFMLYIVYRIKLNLEYSKDTRATRIKELNTSIINIDKSRVGESFPKSPTIGQMHKPWFLSETLTFNGHDWIFERNGNRYIFRIGENKIASCKSCGSKPIVNTHNDWLWFRNRNVTIRCSNDKCPAEVLTLYPLQCKTFSTKEEAITCWNKLHGIDVVSIPITDSTFKITLPI